MAQYRSERKKQGLSQEETANRCDITKSAITKAEIGDRVPNLNTFLEMCRGIGYMVVIAPIPTSIKPEIIVEKVIVEVEKDIDYDNWRYKNE